MGRGEEETEVETETRSQLFWKQWVMVVLIDGIHFVLSLSVHELSLHVANTKLIPGSYEINSHHSEFRQVVQSLLEKL